MQPGWPTWCGHRWNTPGRTLSDSAAYVAEHAAEMSRDVQARHIELYVNDYTRDLGIDGYAAAETLLARGARCRTHAERPSPAVIEGGREPRPSGVKVVGKRPSNPATLRASPLSG